MAPPYLNPSPPSSFLELSGDHDHQYHHLSFNNLEPQTSFSSSSLSNPLFLTPAQVQQPSDDHNISIEVPQKFQFQLLEGADHIVSCGGSCDDHHQTLDQNEGDQSGTLIKLSIFKNGSADRNYDENQSSEINSTSSVKWMSSKMRIMRKMTSPDQTISSSTSTTTDHAPMNLISSSHKLEDDQQKLHPSSSSSPLGTDQSCSNLSSNNMMNPIRVCSDCNTTKTPLWRSGPRGPKSLCNACGIRQRKARRAMAAAANDTTLAVEARPTMKSMKVKQKGSKSRIKGCSSSTVPFKKRCKLTSPPSSQGRPKKQLCFEDFTIMMNDTNSSGSATVQRVFPQDEKEAAILLMALSCGLVHG